MLIYFFDANFLHSNRRNVRHSNRRNVRPSNRRLYYTTSRTTLRRTMG